MDTCGTCTHVQALHEARTGHCRLNGCRCGEFSQLRTLEPEPQAAVATPATVPVVSVEAFTAVISAVTFVVGLLIGLSL